MKTTCIKHITIALITVSLLAGCTHIGKANFPEPTASFSAKQTYVAPYDKVWDATVNALDANHIAAASTDKAGGLIQTDMIEGPSALIGLGLIGAQSSRYKFNITLRNQSEGKVRVNIIAKIESTIKGSSGASQWTDVTSQNTTQARNLETWLYEQIEKGL